MLNQSLLEGFCESFFGYGAASASYWFISMEEGGGTTEQEVQARLNAWEIRGCRELEDIDAYHRAIGQDKWFQLHPPIQRTWAAMIRVVLAHSGEKADVESVRAYQRDRLARAGGETRLSPLFPLPAKSLDDWQYGKWSGSERLSSRANYRAALESRRVTHLASAIAELGPPRVVFFGLSYLNYWSQIAGIPLQPVGNIAHIGATEQTRFVACRHPATKGISNEYFSRIGAALKAG